MPYKIIKMDEANVHLDIALKSSCFPGKDDKSSDWV